MASSGPRSPARSSSSWVAGSPLETLVLLPWVASPSFGFACLSGGRKARPLPGPDQFGPRTGWAALTCPVGRAPALAPACQPPALHLQTKGGIAFVVAPSKAPGDALSGSQVVFISSTSARACSSVCLASGALGLNRLPLVYPQDELEAVGEDCGGGTSSATQCSLFLC